MAKIPVGTIVHNVEIKPGKGGSIRPQRRFICSVSWLVKVNMQHYVCLQAKCATYWLTVWHVVGTVSNADHMNEKVGKAGRIRWRGIRPRTRAVAMNPVDHPMGGGEGRASGGHPRSRKGLLAKGKKTRHPKKYSDGLIISRRKK
ncbi:MAG: hypothetical protein QM734_04650 [Cyclobacteriaceae bacterium]